MPANVQLPLRLRPEMEIPASLIATSGRKHHSRVIAGNSTELARSVAVMPSDSIPMVKSR
ncbi:hypothetical protein W02_07360 [Nitrospira sp. KM1]|nr:hypothetical protein W02_07360 [Nitrospira sp. KM1]